MGKSTYEAKWMQEIERRIGGRGSSILKQDERKKLLRDEGWSLDIETNYINIKSVFLFLFFPSLYIYTLSVTTPKLLWKFPLCPESGSTDWSC